MLCYREFTDCNSTQMSASNPNSYCNIPAVMCAVLQHKAQDFTLHNTYAISLQYTNTPALPGCCAPVSAPHRPLTNPPLLLLGAAGTIVADAADAAAAAFRLLDDENDGSSRVDADVALEVNVGVRVLSSSATCRDFTRTSVAKHHSVYVVLCSTVFRKCVKACACQYTQLRAFVCRINTCYEV
jgi:hypothetical protein